MNLIDDSVIIDFKVPNSIQNLMNECERLNEINDFGTYMNYSEALGYMCKEACVNGLLTDKQWQTIERRYESL